jgi:hypothetical protein
MLPTNGGRLVDIVCLQTKSLRNPENVDDMFSKTPFLIRATSLIINTTMNAFQKAVFFNYT